MGLITQSLVFAAGAFVGWKAKQIYDEKKQALLGEDPYVGQYVTDEGEIIDFIVDEPASEEAIIRDTGFYKTPPEEGGRSIREGGMSLRDLARTVTPVRPAKLGMGRRALYPNQSRKYYAGPLTTDSQRRMPTRRTK